MLHVDFRLSHILKCINNETSRDINDERNKKNKKKKIFGLVIDLRLKAIKFCRIGNLGYAKKIDIS